MVGEKETLSMEWRHEQQQTNGRFFVFVRSFHWTRKSLCHEERYPRSDHVKPARMRFLQPFCWEWMRDDYNAIRYEDEIHACRAQVLQRTEQIVHCLSEKLSLFFLENSLIAIVCQHRSLSKTWRLERREIGLTATILIGLVCCSV